MVLSISIGSLRGLGGQRGRRGAVHGMGQRDRRTGSRKDRQRDRPRNRRRGTVLGTAQGAVQKKCPKDRPKRPSEGPSEPLEGQSQGAVSNGRRKGPSRAAGVGSRGELGSKHEGSLRADASFLGSGLEETLHQNLVPFGTPLMMYATGRGNASWLGGSVSRLSSKGAKWLRDRTPTRRAAQRIWKFLREPLPRRRVRTDGRFPLASPWPRVRAALHPLAAPCSKGNFDNVLS
mmetsp:Transcript_23001/g.77719  ORF Transcript_23001/g.77719 Transcript_23001/m.77719 type:complete len:233 (-) Transcript_23001:46-744(-)